MAIGRDSLDPDLAEDKSLLEGLEHNESIKEVETFEGSDAFSGKTVLGIICFIIGFGFIYNGIIILPVTSWFGPTPGLILIGIGGCLFVSGYGLMKS